MALFAVQNDPECSTIGPLFFGLLLLSELRINLDEGRNDEGDGTKRHDEDEERAVAHEVLEVARHHSGQHQSEIGDAGADGIVGGLELAHAVEEHVECQGGEAKAVAELLDEEAATDGPQVAGHGIAHVDVDNVGQRDGHHHWPPPVFQSVAAGNDAADDAAKGQSDESDGAAGQSELLWRQAQAALAAGAHEEGGAHLGEHGFGKAVEQQEEHGHDRGAQGQLGEEGS